MSSCKQTLRLGATKQTFVSCTKHFLSGQAKNKTRSPCQDTTVSSRATVPRQQCTARCKRPARNSWWHYQRATTGSTEFCQCSCTPIVHVVARILEAAAAPAAEGWSGWTLDRCHLAHRSTHAGTVLLHECSNHVAVQLLRDRSAQAPSSKKGERKPCQLINSQSSKCSKIENTPICYERVNTVLLSIKDRKLNFSRKL